MKDLANSAYTLLGIRLSGAQLSAFQLYERELLDWNTRFNLTAIQKPDQVRTKHFLDSLSCLHVMGSLTGERVIDIGTGAGFPGLPIKIIYPGIQLTLVESVGKKANFCQHIVDALHLRCVTVIQERAETLGQMPEHREQYDWALARAVASMPVLMELLLPLARVGGKVLAMKGASAPAETQGAEHAVKVLGGSIQKLARVHLPGVAEERYLVVVGKTAATAHTYPRRAGVPAKKPL